MSAWIILVRELHAIGGSARRAELNDGNAELWALHQARDLGLLTCNSRGSNDAKWTLTDKGRDFCEGRIKPKGRRGGIRFEATWLRSFPAPTRIDAAPQRPEYKPSRSAALRDWLAQPYAAQADTPVENCSALKPDEAALLKGWLFA